MIDRLARFNGLQIAVQLIQVHLAVLVYRSSVLVSKVMSLRVCLSPSLRDPRYRVDFLPEAKTSTPTFASQWDNFLRILEHQMHMRVNAYENEI